MTIIKINLRWCVEGMKHIFDIDSLIKKKSQPKRNIVVERRIDLMGLVGAPDLQTSFDPYRLGWISHPQGSYILAID